MDESTVKCPQCGHALPAGAAECPNCSAPTMDLRTPFPSVSGYRILRFLGEGGMGAVYLAEDETLGRRVAVKVVSEKFAGEGEARARFLREARAMATVEHPHIVRVYSFGEVGGRPYFVMEYVEGEILAERIRQAGKLPVSEALEILRQAVEALEAAWEKRIVHRDIKPSNILLDKRGRVRVADFGLAKPLQMPGDATLSQQGYILGTPHYVSPEQARGHTVDFRSDIYSLGIVLYEMLAGERPFAGTTPFDVVDKQIHEPLPPLKQKRPDAPESVVRLLDSMTQKRPEARPDSYQSLLQNIDTILGRSPGTPIPLEPSWPVVARPRWLKAAGFAALALVVTVAAWFGWKTFRGAPPAPSPGEVNRLIVAITPFYGPDDDSMKEGRVMAALVDREISNRLGKENAKVLGIEETKQPVRDHDAARALGERLGASVVIWGEAFTLRGETEIQPYFTMVPEKKAEKPEEMGMQKMALGADPLAAIQERTARAVVVGAAAPNQIQLRKTSAAGVSDVVLFLAGMHALYREKNAVKALAFFEQSPRTAESLRYRAQALLELDRKDQAIAALHDAVKLDPHDAQSYAQLGDLHMEAGAFKDAVAAYRTASGIGTSTTTRRGVFYDGKFYTPETVRSQKYTQGAPQDTPYMLALDPASGKVLERYRLPGLARSFASRTGAVSITCAFGSEEGARETTIGFSRGKFDRPVFLDANLWLRRVAMSGGFALAANFMQRAEALGEAEPATFAPTSGAPLPDAPRTLKELEAALRGAIARDPTQPWHLFFLGQTLWAEGHKDEAEKTWRALLEGGFPATPYYEFVWMATFFERLGQRDWADRAYQEALRRRKQLPQPIEASAFIIERLISLPFVRRAAALSQKGIDLDRAYLWLERAREISGLCLEGEEFAAAAWERYFRSRGEIVKAEHEAEILRKTRSLPMANATLVAEMEYALYFFVTFLMGSLAVAGFLLANALGRVTASSEPGLEERSDPTSAGLWPRFLALPRWAVSGLLTSLGGIVLLELLFYPADEDPRGLLVAFPPALLFLVVLFRRRIPNWRRVVASISSRERRVLAAAFLALLAAAQFVVVPNHSMLGLWSIELGMMDALGNDLFVRQFEATLKDHDADETRYAAAVANHMAGNVKRARELYQQLPRDPRAGQNLAALNKGELVPPVPLTVADVARARFAISWKEWLENLPHPPMMYDLLRYVDAPTWPAAISFLFFPLGLMNVVLLLAVWRIPSGNHFDLPRPGSRLARGLSKAVLFLVPGAYDLRRGSPWRGYAGFTLFALPLLVGLVQLMLALAHQGPGPGLISGYSAPNPFRAFAFPTPPGLADLDAVAAYHYWTIFWTYPYARIFWSLVALAAAVSLALHVSRFRRIWRLYE